MDTSGFSTRNYGRSNWAPSWSTCRGGKLPPSDEMASGRSALSDGTSFHPRPSPRKLKLGASPAEPPGLCVNPAPPPPFRQEVEKAEKGKKADDSVIAGLLKGLVGSGAVDASDGLLADPGAPCGEPQKRRSPRDHVFISRLSSLRKRQSVCPAMSFCGSDLINPASCMRSA